MTPHESVSLVERVQERLAGPGGPPWEEILAVVIEHMGCTVGTLHLLDRREGLLRLCAQRNVPAVVIGKVQAVPIGKGMAGLAAERREPVQVCNLQQDQSVVRPGAKATGAEGSIACPMLCDGELVGVLGVAKLVPYDFSAEETALLMAVGRSIAARALRLGNERDR
jgi:signal transduction protein with GAF and PtsI domain